MSEVPLCSEVRTRTIPRVALSPYAQTHCKLIRLSGPYFRVDPSRIKAAGKDDFLSIKRETCIPINSLCGIGYRGTSPISKCSTP